MGKAAVLLSGGKDSVYAAWLAKQRGYELTCLVSIFSQNPDSYMFHTPSIKKVEEQAKVMEIPLLIQKTKGEKEEELKDLETAIKRAKSQCKIDTVITGALKSEYQATRIQDICDKLKLQCYNPLWKKDELNYLNELVENKFKIIITAVAAYPLDKTWLGREINRKFIEEAIDLNNKYKIHVAGEGGEFETFVLNCPLFKKPLRVKSQKITGSNHSWGMEIEIE